VFLRRRDIVVDSGASRIYFCDERFFTDIQPLTHPIYINTAEKDRVCPVIAVGRVELHVEATFPDQTSNQIITLIFNEAYLAPEFGFNLLSTHRISHDESDRVTGHSFIDGPEGSYFMLKSAIQIKLTTTSGIKVLKPALSPTESRLRVTMSSDDSTTTDLDDQAFLAFAAANKSLTGTPLEVHRLLGHVNMKTVCQLLGTGKTKETFCYSCAMSKNPRQPVAKAASHSITYKPGQLTHSDIWGPVSTPSYAGKRFAVLFVDEATHFMSVFAIEKKSDLLEAFKEHRATLGRHGITIGPKCTIQSDNALEYTAGEFAAYCKLHFITQRFSPTYTASMNGKAERMWRTIFEMVRSMLFDAGLSLLHWAHALYHAEYLINRLPSRAINGKIPLQCLTGRKPDLSQLHIFGQRVCVGLEPRPALGPQSEDGIYIGCAEDTIGHIIWIPARRNTTVSRNVQFEPMQPRRVPPDPSLDGLLDPREAQIELGPVSTDDSTGHPSLEVSMIPTSTEPPVEPAPVGPSIAPPRSVDPLAPTRRSSRLQAAPPTRRSLRSPYDARIIDKFTDNSGPVYRVHYNNTEPGDDEWLPATKLRDKQHLIDAYEVSIADSTELDALTDHGTNQFETEIATIALIGAPCTEDSPDASDNPSMASPSAPFLVTSDPQSLREALASPNSREWTAAIHTEARVLKDAGTFSIVPRKPWMRLLRCKFIFKLKRNADGTIERFKARLVALGFMQREGIDFFEVFAPVVHYDTIRAFLAIVAELNLELHMMDVQSAFLNPTIEEELYMEIPKGAEQFFAFDTPVSTSDCVLRLHKSLYGLRQAPRRWNETIHAALISLGFQRSQSDPCLYLRDMGTDRAMIVTIFVDDMLIGSKSLEAIEQFKADITAKFKMSDLGEAKLCLGIEIRRDRSLRTLSLSQPRYINDILSRFKHHNIQPKDIPMRTDAHSGIRGEPHTNQGEYRTLVGSLMYLATSTRPDIAYATSFLARHMQTPCEEHWNMAIHVLGYLKKTATMGITYGKLPSGHHPNTVIGYSDASHNNPELSSKSVTGNVFYLNGGAIAWASKTQSVTAQSTLESEYIALARAAKEIVYLRRILEDLGHEQNTTTLFGDNQPSIQLATNYGTSSRTKHIDLRYHYIREVVAAQIIQLEYLRTDSMVADILTKPLAKDAFRTHRDHMLGSKK
jgi:hypothetical protein